MPDGSEMKILFVEDPESASIAVAGEVHRQFAIQTAPCAEQGLELISRCGPFAVVVSDLHMQEINGIDFLREVRQKSPHSVCVILTGPDDLNVAVDAINEGIVFRFLTKPCPPDLLGKTLKECLEQHVAERKAFAKALEKSEAGYRQMVANLPGLVYRFTLHKDGSIKFLFLSRSCKELFGLEPESVKEDSGVLMNRFRSEDRGDFYHMIAESAATLEPYQWRGCGQFNDNKRWFHGVCRPQRLSNDDVVWDGILVDITDLKHAEEEKEQLAKFPSENPNPVMKVNASGLIVYANKAGEHLLDGWGGKLGGPLPDDLFDLVVRLRGSGDHECLEAKCREHVYSIVVASVKGADYVNLYARDITEAKHAESKLIKANERLREHDRLKSEFVSTVSHELRTPLCIFKNITSNAMAGVMGKISRKLYENLQTAEQSIDRLSKIISDFLDVSKIESDCLELDMTILTVQSIVTEVADSLQALAQAKGIEIKTALYGEAIEISADRERLTQILANLIGNAIKFIPANGHITVKVDDCGKEVQFSVEDDGPGLSEEDVEKIFDRFVQIRLISGPGHHGTGLGLAITRELVKMHGGRIWIESTLGEGCRFCFVLPKCGLSAQEDGVEPELVESQAARVGS